MTPCPSCGSIRTAVVLVTDTDAGERLRRRRCQICEHRWYTLQPPEQEIDPESIVWPKWKSTGRRPPVRIIPTEEAFNAAG